MTNFFVWFFFSIQWKPDDVVWSKISSFVFRKRTTVIKVWNKMGVSKCRQNSCFRLNCAFNSLWLRETVKWLLTEWRYYTAVIAAQLQSKYRRLHLKQQRLCFQKVPWYSERRMKACEYHALKAIGFFHAYCQGKRANVDLLWQHAPKAGNIVTFCGVTLGAWYLITCYKLFNLSKTSMKQKHYC